MSFSKRDLDNRFEDAYLYLTTCVKEGHLDEEELDEILEGTKVSVVLFAEGLMEKGDAYLDSYKENQYE